MSVGKIRMLDGLVSTYPKYYTRMTLIPRGEGVVAEVDPADGAALEHHVVLSQGASLITE
jgi:hypothetical protein